MKSTAKLGIAATTLLLLPFCSAQASYPSNTTGPIVDLGYARYQGNTSYRANFSVDVFYGIRFAKAPIGNLRWQAPQDIESHNDYSPAQIIDARAPSPSCVQGTPAWRAYASNIPTPVAVTGQEDCLLLNVYVPEKPKATLVPVMLMVHGGGYTQGSANGAGNQGQAIVGTSGGDIIYVSIQYRLSIYGFLSSAEVREDGVANAGLLDQRSAFNWVQRNIRAFGGDPARVTIIGGSAGGSAVMNQMIMYGGVSNPPFRAVVAEYPWWQPYHNNTILQNQYRNLLSASNCTTLACLRGLSTEALKTAGQKTYSDAYYQDDVVAFGDFYYGPSVDGNIIRDLPSNEFKQGHFTKVPLLVDHDGYEGYLYTNRSETTIEQETTGLMKLFPYAKQTFFDRLYQLYPREAYNSTLFQREKLFGDFIIMCPTYYMASAISDWGLPAYKLIFNAGTQLHGATAPFIFQPTDAAYSNNLTISAYMKDWFISFVTDLDPNARSYSNASKPHWPLYNPALGIGAGQTEFAIMDVNYTQIGVIPDLDVKAGCDFFHGRSYEVRN
ncbi:hypothetical protein B0A48_06568 [Cryoendolithus antarcticus]|uniref:Carboxylic ester hydrolase n=1 Tax=Cryoendolithus antarcticus TaxID=1507870 RepID=A0A1V8TBS1_9PEZI|nr:hypothetical protein B0A48_06568 [Cryoendolithus antarcticus]